MKKRDIMQHIHIFISENVLRTLAHELHHFKVNKTDLGWDLDELEEVNAPYYMIRY
jgi:hypothetical protein